MHLVVNLLFLGVLLLVTTIADGKASAQITFAGRSIATSGGGAADFFLVPFAVGGGQTSDYEYEYSIQLMDDGLTGPREASPSVPAPFPRIADPVLPVSKSPTRRWLQAFAMAGLQTRSSA
jgi:hypothetical protein